MSVTSEALRASESFCAAAFVEAQVAGKPFSVRTAMNEGLFCRPDNTENLVGEVACSACGACFVASNGDNSRTTTRLKGTTTLDLVIRGASSRDKRIYATTCDTYPLGIPRRLVGLAPAPADPIEA